MEGYEIRKHTVGLKIHAGHIDDEIRKRIDYIVAHPAIKELVAIMPDVHGGEDIVGLTCRFKDAVIPSLPGVDLGCGVLSIRLECDEIDFEALDNYIRKNIPTGFNSRNEENISSQNFLDKLPMTLRHRIYDVSRRSYAFLEDNNLDSKVLPSQQIGTLGGGNHFIEIEKGSEGELYLTIHSGSRNFGLKVAGLFQKLAQKVTKEMNIRVPKGLEYLPLSCGGDDYLTMVKLAQDYAQCNRLAMMHTILRFLGEDRDEEIEEGRIIESVHNYISSRYGIVRKGAISAHKGERLVIPLNMGAGIVIGTGKGNKDYNWSTAHGAGRLYGRMDMNRRLESGTFYSMEAFKESMKGIFTTSVDRSTFDESPFAYKPWESILPFIYESVDVEQVAKPVYNLKAIGK